MIQKLISEDAARGMLVGLALGDSLGNGGLWTSHTTHALCLAQMLRSANGWDAEDAMRRLINWRNHGYLSATRVCDDIDPGTDAGLKAFEDTGNPYSGPDDSAGSTHPISRLAPIVIAYGARVDAVQAVAQLQSRLTHSARSHTGAAANLSEVLITGRIDTLPQPDTAPTGPKSSLKGVLGASFWALTQGADFQTRVAAAVPFGTACAALTGQLAGRVAGYNAIPTDLTATLHDHAKILTIADDLHAMRPIDL